MQSRITGGITDHLFNATILNKYEIGFFRCRETGFIQTEEPFWLEEAYSSAITKLDLGLVQRNIELSEQIHPLLYRHFNHQSRFIDYAGGYGMFTRLMRNKGFDFYHTDKYCSNIFAEDNDLKYCSQKNNFEVLTSFEVFEHLTNPVAELEEMLKLSPNILFSTVLIPQPAPDADKWWYYSLETGQHISFYTESSLAFLANKFNKHFYTNGKNIHLFSEKKLNGNPFRSLPLGFLFKLCKSVEKKIKGKKKSMLDFDIARAKQKLQP